MNRRVVRRALALLLMVLLAVAGGAIWLARSGQPVRAGELRLPGLQAAVEVRWDAWGVPHLRGESGRDLALALGYLHANDRMTQLELGRRAVAGRLSEAFGEATLEMDIEARTLRLRPAAVATWDRLGAESRSWFEAYSAGVNAWLASRGGDLPPTLKLFGIRPEPWTPVDSLGFAILMARDLSFWQGRPEELRFEWLRRFGPERTRDLLGEAVHVPDAILAAARMPPAAGGRAASARPPPSLPPGSNNWALDAARSAEGRPLVANDLHLPIHLPGLWYQAHFRAPDFEVMGITLPGLPGVIVGQNAHLAWAVTNVMMDDHDLFFEELDEHAGNEQGGGEGGGRVRRGDAWVPLATEKSEIRVRGQAPISFVLRATDRGPLLPADPARGLPARSLAWTATLNTDPLAPFLHLARARKVADIPGGLDGLACPAQHLVAADRDGGLLHIVLGRMPQRRQGDGRLPAPGWEMAYGWDGLRPADANPHLVAVDGLVVTANEDIRPPGQYRALVGDFDLPARARRIRELLAGQPRWHAAELAAVQADVVSSYARELVALSGGPHRGAARQAYDQLAAWDGRMAITGASALFTLYERHLAAAIFGDELDLAGVSGPVRRGWLLRILGGEMHPDWFDDSRTPAREGRDDIVAQALAAAWEEGVRQWGEDVAGWPYGALHQLVLQHPLGALPVIGRLFDRGPYPLAGSATTVAAFATPSPGAKDQSHQGPTMRWVAVVGDGDRSLAALPGGQSGHPFDRHYDDQLELFLEGRTRPVPWSEAAIRRATVATLRLLP